MIEKKKEYLHDYLRYGDAKNTYEKKREWSLI